MDHGLSMKLRVRWSAPAAFLVMGVVLAACSGDDDIIEPPDLGTVSDLTAEAHGAFEARLAWSDVAGETSYDVHRSTAADFSPSAATRIAQGLASGTTAFTDISLEAETTYYYRVVARDANGSTTGNQATVTTSTVGLFGLVEDGFERTVDPGWGTTASGATWDKDNEAPWRVANGEGIIEVPDSIAKQNVLTDLSTYGRYVYGLIRFRIQTAPDAGFHTVGVYARRDDATGEFGENLYRFNVMAHFDGTMSVRIEKEVDSAHDFVTNATPIAPGFQPDQWYWIRWEATGTAPTTLRMKVWPQGTAEPDAWDLDVDHTEPGLDVKGTTGVRVQASTTHANFPVLFAFDDLSFEGD